MSSTNKKIFLILYRSKNLCCFWDIKTLLIDYFAWMTRTNFTEFL